MTCATSALFHAATPDVSAVEKEGTSAESGPYGPRSDDLSCCQKSKFCSRVELKNPSAKDTRQQHVAHQARFFFSYRCVCFQKILGAERTTSHDAAAPAVEKSGDLCVDVCGVSFVYWCVVNVRCHRAGCGMYSERVMMRLVIFLGCLV